MKHGSLQLYTLQILIPILFVLVIVAVLLSSAIRFNDERSQEREEALMQIETDAQMTAVVLAERLNRVRDTGIALATRVQFRELVEAGEWEQAILMLKDVPTDLPYIRRIFLTDVLGTELADFPPSQGVIGVNFAYRDWYRGAIETQKPYISEAYRRAADPRINVIALSVPIRSVDAERMTGILVIQIPVEVIFDWTKELTANGGRVTSFVDQSGHLMGRENFSADADLPVAIGDVAVARALSGKTGAEVMQNGEIKIIGYAPVDAFGWGVLVERSERSVVAGTWEILRNEAPTTGVLTVFILLLIAILMITGKQVHDIAVREFTFIESAGDGILAIDKKWRITVFNAAAEQITGWSRKEAIGKSVKDVLRVIYSNNRQPNYGFIENVFKSGMRHEMENHTLLIKKNGKEIPVADSAAPIMSRFGVAGVIIVFRDQTSEKEADHMRSSVTFASHQIRTPVTKLNWGLEEMANADSAEAKENLLVGVRASAASLQRIAEQLASVSEVEQENLLIESKPTSFAHEFASLIDETKMRADKRKISFAVEGLQDLPVIVTDARYLKRALEELLTNALIYTKEGGLVTFRGKTTTSGVMFEVEDNGIGIPSEQQQIVFTRFFRGLNVPEGVPGAGLGLYICRRIANALQGKVWFHSEEGIGTRFSFFVPDLGKEA